MPFAPPVRLSLAFQPACGTLCPETECLADSGYLGLKKCHDNSHLPSKNTKLHSLTNEQKDANHKLSRERFVIRALA